MVAFSDVAAALACAIAIQEAVAVDNHDHPKERLEVRIGLNCGQAIKEEEDFFGGAVVVAARIGALAKGGQILVSETVRGLAQLRREVRYVHHGRRRLKGLDGKYDVWSVPWGSDQAPRLPGPWGMPAFRTGMAAVAFVVIAGGVAGGIILSRSGGDGPPLTPGFQEVTFQISMQTEGQLAAADCASQDLVVTSTYTGTASGDISGHVTGGGETTLSAEDACQSGVVRDSFTVTDQDGNTLSWDHEGPGSVTTSGRQEPAATSFIAAVTITGGTGIYAGATGQGTCTILGIVTFEETDSFTGTAEATCALKIATSGSGTVDGPLTIQLGARPAQVTVFGGPDGAPDSLRVLVLYRNTGAQAQRGLSLTLPEPAGTTILAAAQGEEQPPSPGELTWSLPDLPAGELRRFELTLQFLSVETSSVSLVVEIDGDGFQQPVRSDSVTIVIVTQRPLSVPSQIRP